MFFVDVRQTHACEIQTPIALPRILNVDVLTLRFEIISDFKKLPKIVGTKNSHVPFSSFPRCQHLNVNTVQVAESGRSP